MKKIIICVLSVLFINIAFGSPEDEFTEEELKINKEFDQAFEELNKELPKKIAPNMTIDRNYREGKKVYFIYTGTDQSYKAVDLIKLEKSKQEKLMPQLCTYRQYEYIISIGYSFTYIYNTFDKKDVFRIVADKDTCAKYW